MGNYYDQKLNADGLFQVYQSDIPRVLEYLNSEIEFVKEHINKTEDIIEIGAGYGRIMKELSPYCKSILGIDISEKNIELGNEYLKNCENTTMKQQDVHNLSIEKTFDIVLCLQNGLSAIKADHKTIENILNLLKPGGKAFFSSYSENFWNYRLAWFQEQADKGLLGEIDLENTKDGVIVCKDGFRATTYSEEDFIKIGETLGYEYEIVEVDKSSLFLIVMK